MTSIGRLIGLLVIAGAASFGATIDNFNGALVTQTVRDNTADAMAVTDILGNRTIFANKSAGATGLFLDSVVAAATEGFFAGSAGTTVTGATGASYTGLWNLAAPIVGLSMEVIGNDLAGSTISFWISDGTNTASSGAFALPVVPGPPGQLIIALLGGFSGIGSVNLSAITSLGFINTHVANGDLSLDNFQTYVPEPGTYAMMAAGLLALYSIRRKKA